MSKGDDFWDKKINKNTKWESANIPSKQYWAAYGKNKSIPKDAIVIGKNKDGVSTAYLPLDAFDTHIHILGATRTGKSYFLEALIREFITQGLGGCLITPHAEIYNNLENFISHFPELAKKVVFFNPAQRTEQYIGFNPLKHSDYFPISSVQIDQIVDCGLAVWRDDPEVAKKVIQWFTNILWCLIDGGMTLPDAIHFLSDPRARKKLVNLTQNGFIRGEWEAFEKLSHRDREDAFSSLKRRIPRFSTSPSVWYTLGRTENVLDIQDIVENQKILLCNFSEQENIISSEDAYLIGTLLISEIVNYCKTQRNDRAIAKAKPFFLMIDEAHRFLSMKISEALAECAKNGLHMVLAHQNLAQLKVYNEQLFHNVMQNARTKVVFGGIEYADLKILEEDIFVGEHDFKKIKDEIYRTTVVGFSEETRIVETSSSSSSTTEGSFESEGESTGRGEATAVSTGYLPSIGFFGTPVYDTSNPNSLNESRSSQESNGNSSSKGRSSVESSSHGESQTEVPFLMPILDKELSSRQFYTLQELREQNIASLKNIPPQNCFIKVREKPVQQIKVKTVVDFARDPDKIKVAHQISQENQAQYYLSVSQITELIEKRRERLQLNLNTEEPEDFRE